MLRHCSQDEFIQTLAPSHLQAACAACNEQYSPDMVDTCSYFPGPWNRSVLVATKRLPGAIFLLDVAHPRQKQDADPIYGAPLMCWDRRRLNGPCFASLQEAKQLLHDGTIAFLQVSTCGTISSMHEGHQLPINGWCTAVYMILESLIQGNPTAHVASIKF